MLPCAFLKNTRKSSFWGKHNFGQGSGQFLLPCRCFSERPSPVFEKKEGFVNVNPLCMRP